MGSSQSRFEGSPKFPTNSHTTRSAAAMPITTAPSLPRPTSSAPGAATGSSSRSGASSSWRHWIKTRHSRRSASTNCRQAAHVSRCSRACRASFSGSSPSAYTAHVNSSRQATSVLLFELLPELLLAPENQCRDVIAAQPQRGRNFVVTELVVIGQHQRHAILFRELALRMTHVVTPLGG